MPMLDRNDSLLIVVDVQERFYGGLLDEDAERLGMWRTARHGWPRWQRRSASRPWSPRRTRPQRAHHAGHPPLAAGRRARFAKSVFGLADAPEIMAAIEASGRRTAVLAGLETDVCVAHSAIGLNDLGYRVAVVADATFSPGEMQAHGLRRIAGAGVELVHAKGVYYEWVRTLGAARAFQTARPDLARAAGLRAVTTAG